MNLPDRTSSRRVVAATTLVASLALVPSLRPFTASAAPSRADIGSQASGCTLANGIKHVIFIEFDNTHFMRDIGRDGSTNVPSDLEQMPHLLNFIEGKGTLLSNHHTPLISHTSDDITTTETGVYPSRHGVATAANSYFYYDQSGTPQKTSGFSYWTSKIGDGQYNFTSAPNTNAPAPWVPFTRAGCNVGAAGMTGMVPESKTDLATIFGAGSPPTKDPGYFADYIGVAVHCAAGNALCSSANGGVADVLPDEPNPDGSVPGTPGAGYQGFNALYGHKLLAQAINPDHTNLNDINGNPIVDDFPVGTLTPGFPGFSLAPQYALGYTADMQENGVPVTFAYIITPHRPLPANPYNYGFPSDPSDYGPGEAHYVAQLHQYDAAFADFFTRLANDGIDQSNSLFVFTSEEGDHFVGGPASPAGCDGATVSGNTVTPDMYCTYSHIGELETNYDGLLQGEQGATLPSASPPVTTATVNNDDAPDIYLKGMPGPSDPLTRSYERATGSLSVTNPISVTLGLSQSQSTEPLVQYMANLTEFKILHMLTADPLRTPTFTAFAQPDYYVVDQNQPPPLPAPLPSCGTSVTPAADCVLQVPGFAWNHGNVQPQISTTWVGFVGPGVLNRGVDGPNPTQEALGARFGTFSDHTDIRPTMLQLLGLHDDYTSDGRVLIEDLADSALPPALQSGGATRALYIQLAELYKQLNAPVGQFDLSTLQTSTIALNSNSPGDSVYYRIESALMAAGIRRDVLTSLILRLLNQAFATDQQQALTSVGLGAQLTRQAYDLLAQSAA